MCNFSTFCVYVFLLNDRMCLTLRFDKLSLLLTGSCLVRTYSFQPTDDLLYSVVHTRGRYLQSSTHDIACHSIRTTILTQQRDLTVSLVHISSRAHLILSSTSTIKAYLVYARDSHPNSNSSTSISLRKVSYENSSINLI